MQTFRIVLRLNGLTYVTKEFMYVTHLVENKMAAWSDSPTRGSEIVVIDKEMKEYCTSGGLKGGGGRVINVCVCAWRKAREKSAFVKGQCHKIFKYFFIVNIVSDYCKLISHLA